MKLRWAKYCKFELLRKCVCRPLGDCCNSLRSMLANLGVCLTLCCLESNSACLSVQLHAELWQHLVKLFVFPVFYARWFARQAIYGSEGEEHISQLLRNGEEQIDLIAAGVPSANITEFADQVIIMCLEDIPIWLSVWTQPTACRLLFASLKETMRIRCMRNRRQDVGRVRSSWQNLCQHLTMFPQTCDGCIIPNPSIFRLFGCLQSMPHTLICYIRGLSPNRYVVGYATCISRCTQFFFHGVLLLFSVSTAVWVGRTMAWASWKWLLLSRGVSAQEQTAEWYSGWLESEVGPSGLPGQRWWRAGWGAWESWGQWW